MPEPELAARRARYEDSVVRGRYGLKTLLIGTTGTRKTTLLNSLLESRIGLARAGSSQSACPLTVRYGNRGFLVEIEYRNLDELYALFELAMSGADTIDATKRPDEQGVDKSVIEAFSNIFRSKTIPKNKTEFRANFIDSVATSLRERWIRRRFAPSDFDEMWALIGDYTNPTGKFWIVADQVRVSGPSRGLSPGTEIVDLPGTGDINRVRKSITASAMLLTIEASSPT
jgi:hypothetical protein